MLDLRGILDRNRIPWRDRGANCSAGNVNIACPFCKNDPSFHLSISESGSGWYCWRNSRHQGGSLYYLFNVLKIPTAGLNLKSGKEQTEAIVAKPAEFFREFHTFSSAIDNQEALNYLSERGFSNPRDVCKRFDLRIASIGKWAGRLIIPLTSGWTGRAMRAHLSPRYLSQTDATGLFSYGKSSSVIIVEGPLDALRIASLTDQFAVIATLGQRLSPSLLLYLCDMGFASIYLVPDADVPSHLYLYFLRYLQSYCPGATVQKVNLPPGAKDAAELSEEKTYQWLHVIGSRFFQSGPDLGNNGLKTIAARTGGV